jgi:hypothetical protein
VIVSSWSDTSITITIPVGATTGPLVVSVAPLMNDSNPVYFEVTAQALPTGWLDQDVGAAGVPGSATFSNGVFTVQGSGTDIWGTADGFHFVYQPLSGDGTITARVVSLQPGYCCEKAGVMIRETMSPEAADAYMAYQAGAAIFIDRPGDGGSNGQAGITGAGLPYWVQVVRSGNTFTAYGSLDGVNWVQVGGSQTITMAETVYVGLAVTDNYNSALATATFDNVSVNGVMASLEDVLPFLYAYSIGGRSQSGVPSGSTTVMDSAVGPTTGVLAPMTWSLFAGDLFPESATTEPLGRFLYALPGDSMFESRRRASQDR